MQGFNSLTQRDGAEKWRKSGRHRVHAEEIERSNKTEDLSETGDGQEHAVLDLDIDAGTMRRGNGREGGAETGRTSNRGQQ